MISSIVWLYLFLNNHISNEIVFWTVYLPIQIIELVIFLYLLPKIADLCDKFVEGNK